jgi:FkbM family methyltransferase
MIHRTTIKDFLVSYTNEEEFKGLKKEIFDLHAYYFETEKTQPLIIDIGAHIGLSSLYFSYLYPLAQITAVEPHPLAYQLLQENFTQNNLTNITTHQAAVTPQGQSLTLFTDTENDWLSTTSLVKGAWTQNQSTKPFTAKGVTLRQLVETYRGATIDLVKMDIEGAEHQVLPQAGEELSLIKELIIEYHPNSKHSIITSIDRLKKFGLSPSEPLNLTPKKIRQLQLIRFLNHKHFSK